MDFCTRIKQIRLSTRMTRKQFCAYFDIPYRTVTEWERGTRHAPPYVLKLLEYYVTHEGLVHSFPTEVNPDADDEETEMCIRDSTHCKGLPFASCACAAALHPAQRQEAMLLTAWLPAL